MKRKSLAALFMAAVVFASCSKEEEKSPEITLEKDSVTLTSGGEFLINASSDYDLTYKSEDRYHATVDEKGLVTARCVGETNIVVSNTETSKKVKITVMPEYDIYEDLCQYLGKTKSQILSKFGDHYTSAENYIIYEDYTSYVSDLMFKIENDVVKDVLINVDKSYWSTLEGYLKERYVFAGKANEAEVGVLSEIGVYKYFDNTDEAKIKTKILVWGFDDTDRTFLAVSYSPYPY